MANIGKFILHRFIGDEEFVIATATILPVKEEDGIRLWFEVEADGKRVRSVPDTAKFHAEPKAEVGVDVKRLDPDNLVGRRFSVASGYDEEKESYVGTIYYFEHELLSKNKINVLSRKGNVFHVRWSGVTTDVNYYDGSKPETRVEIEGQFTFKDMKKWIRK